MIADLVDIVESLALIMEEETMRLKGPERGRGQQAIVEAKLRLVAALEIRVAQLARRGTDWLDMLAEGDRAVLMAALARLRDAAEPNARSLSRHIDLSREMMGVVATEAQRLSGNRSATYGEQGALSHIDQPTPISVNTNV
jgi:flagellar biosynthesis/type III secretory pathway chaperone